MCESVYLQTNYKTNRKVYSVSNQAKRKVLCEKNALHITKDLTFN